MRRYVTLFFMLLLWPVVVSAEVEWQVEHDLKLPSAPLDIASGADGMKTFVLLENGRVRIYGADGSLQETLALEGKADRLAVTSDGGRLLLSDSKTGQVRVVSLEYVKSIDISGSPVKGPSDANVVVAVYSDFQ